MKNCNMILTEEQITTIEDQGKKQIKPIVGHIKQLVESNELIKKMLISTKIVYYLQNQKKIFNELIEEISSGFKDLEKRIN